MIRRNRLKFSAMDKMDNSIEETEAGVYYTSLGLPPEEKVYYSTIGGENRRLEVREEREKLVKQL